MRNELRSAKCEALLSFYRTGPHANMSARTRRYEPRLVHRLSAMSDVSEISQSLRQGTKNNDTNTNRLKNNTGTCRKDQTKQRTRTPSTTQTNGPYGEPQKRLAERQLDTRKISIKTYTYNICIPYLLKILLMR